MFKGVFTVSGKSSLTPPTDGVAAVSLDDSRITVPPWRRPEGHSW